MKDLVVYLNTWDVARQIGDAAFAAPWKDEYAGRCFVLVFRGKARMESMTARRVHGQTVEILFSGQELSLQNIRHPFWPVNGYLIIEAERCVHMDHAKDRVIIKPAVPDEIRGQMVVGAVACGISDIVFWEKP